MLAITYFYMYRNQQNSKYVTMLNYISANMITNNYTSRFLYYVFVHGHVASLHLYLIQPSRVAAKLGLWFVWYININILIYIQ